MKLLVMTFLLGFAAQAQAEVSFSADQDTLRRHDRRYGKVQCIAENARGAKYRGRADIGERRRAKRKALRRCESDSFFPRTCHIVYCERIRDGRGGRGGRDGDWGRGGRGGRDGDWGRGGRGGRDGDWGRGRGGRDDDRRGGRRGGRGRGGRR